MPELNCILEQYFFFIRKFSVILILIIPQGMINYATEGKNNAPSESVILQHH